ncbi:MAG: hypothetical protein ACRDJP_00830, partial [Actinomycetota bacterium]
NNVAYSVPALSRVIEPGEPVWKSIVDRRLAALGYRPIVDRGMRVVSLKRYRWRDLAPARVAHGRLYASQRAIGWPRGQRWLSALLCGALPLVAFARLARRVRPDPELRRQFVKAAPLVALALAAWSVGEAVGYVAGAGNHVDVF